MANAHPFHFLFEAPGRLPQAQAESVNRLAYLRLIETLSVPVETMGRCILLKAPRAGHGKTHLLARSQHQLGGTHEFIQLHATVGSLVDAASVTDDTLRRLLRHLPAAGGLCVLDFVVRRLLAAALQPLVASGEVPCQDREGAATALRLRPVETFDFHHPNAITAHWARENFEVLGQRFSIELAERMNLPFSSVTFWIHELFRFASSPIDNPQRAQLLTDAVHQASGSKMERLVALLGLLGSLMRVVLVADDLEGFSADASAALKLAAFLGTLRESVERVDVILSVNDDIWTSAFLPRLSGGLADRLAEVTVELEPLTEMEMADLLDSRVPGLGHRVLQHIDISASGRHARGIVRAAGLAWLKASAMDSMQAGIEIPVPVQPEAMPPAQWTSTPNGVAEQAPTAENAVSWPEPVFVPTPAEPSGADSFAVASDWNVFQPFTPPAVEEVAPVEPTPQAPVAWNVVPEVAPSEFVPATWQEVPAAAPQLSSVAPEPVPASNPNPFVAFQQNEPTPFVETKSSITEAAAVPDTDRVDDLLRQFRERYGRGSL
jgi:hypothetical protein